MQVADVMDTEELESYIQSMRQNSTFGDGTALSAAARRYGRSIVILAPEADSRVQHIRLPADDDDHVRYPKMYLGLFSEHYVSVNPTQQSDVTDQTPSSSASGDSDTVTVSASCVVTEYDIGNFIGCEIDDFTKYQLLENHWKPPSGFSFPFS